MIMFSFFRWEIEIIISLHGTCNLFKRRGGERERTFFYTNPDGQSNRLLMPERERDTEENATR